MACSKGSIAHTTLSVQDDNSHRHVALLFIKTIWCIKGECDSSDCPRRCYTFKRGQCLKFKNAVMPNYASNANKEHSKAAVEELKAGQFPTSCSREAARAAEQVLAGN